GIAQGGNRDDGREATAVLADVSQFVNIFNAARRLEDQGFKARGNGSSEFGAERLRAHDDFVAIGNAGRCDLVYQVACIVAKHAFSADIEYLDDTLSVGGDAGE